MSSFGIDKVLGGGINCAKLSNSCKKVNVNRVMNAQDLLRVK